MEKVSIIVPVYNVEKYIERCLQSLIKQSYKNIEVIIVDDCSQDDGKKIIEKYSKSDDRIRAIFLSKNQGVSYARNLALTKITGDWICFCDGDDWYEKDFIECMLYCAINEKADYIICDYKIVSENGTKIISKSVNGLETGCDNKIIIAFGPTASCTHLVKSELFLISGVKYPVNCRQFEELPVIPVLAKFANKIGIVKKPLYNYFQRGDGSSASNISNSIEESFMTSMQIMQKALGTGYEKEIEFHAIYALLYGEILRLCKKNYDTIKIQSAIKKYKMMYPNYLSNPYIKFLGLEKKIFLHMVDRNIVCVLRFLAWIHGKIVN